MARQQKRTSSSIGHTPSTQPMTRSRTRAPPVASMPTTQQRQPLHELSTTFTSTLVTHGELFFDQVVPLLPANDLMSLCNALCVSRSGLAAMTDSTQWRKAAEREGLVGSAPLTRTMRCSHGCIELSNYLSRRSQLESFDANVVVLSDDLEKIREIDGVPVDCLVFPTSGSFRNPGIGAAGCVHRRIGPILDNHLAQNRSRGLQESVLATPGFADNIQLLVHCVGPSGVNRDRRALLYSTYLKALHKIETAPTVKCAAVASISTGLLGYPVVEAAEVAMAAVCDTLRTRSWPLDKKIAFVCIDSGVLKAFADARAEARRTFFARGLAFPEHVQTFPA